MNVLTKALKSPRLVTCFFSVSVFVAIAIVVSNLTPVSAAPDPNNPPRCSRIWLDGSRALEEDCSGYYTGGPGPDERVPYVFDNGACYTILESQDDTPTIDPFIITKLDTCDNFESLLVAAPEPNASVALGENTRPGGGGAPLSSVENLPKPSADSDTVSKVIGIVLNISGAIAVLMVTIAGFKYVMSMGHPDATKKAKDTILYALIGLAVVLFAKVIVGFVFNNI